jgi:hypothetical protein
MGKKRCEGCYFYSDLKFMGVKHWCEELREWVHPTEICGKYKRREA